MEEKYSAPTITVLGSVSEVTQSTIYKNAGSGDVIVINSATIPEEGGSVTSVS